MADYLKAGTLKEEAPTSPYAGVDPYVGSMAEAMEKAFEAEWPIIMETEKPKKSKHLQLMFIAVAQGVVKHLRDNISAITVEVPKISTSGTEDEPLKNVETEGRLH